MSRPHPHQHQQDREAHSRRARRQRHASTKIPPLLLVVLVVLLTQLPRTAASLVGDEQYQRQEGGAFWVFHSAGVSIVDPASCAVDHTFDRDAAGNALPSQWSKGAYMQVKTANSAAGSLDDDLPLTATPQLSSKPADAFVLVNSGEQGEVIVMSPNSPLEMPALHRIAVGTSPGNAYAIHNRNQFWTHSDDEGYFYVIDLNSELEEHTGHPIKAKMKAAHHAHLMWEIGIDDDTFSASDNLQVGYATTAGEQFLTLIDMHAHKQLSTYDFEPNVVDGTCKGAASMAYSKNNLHLYIECVGPGGVLEFDVSRPQSPLFIAQHQHVGGTLLETPDQAYVTATDKGTNLMHFFAPQQTGQKSTDPYHIQVKGHPEAPAFYENTMTFDYVACMPTSANTNRNHIDATIVLDQDGNPPEGQPDPVSCDFFNGCSQASNQQDVEHGMCLYRNGKATGPLLTAVKDDLPNVQKYAQPFGRACEQCATDKAYDNNKQRCTCTPQCGSCAKDDYPENTDDPILQTSGVMCIDVKDALLGIARRSDLIVGAGAVRQRPNKIQDPACGFREPVRPHKRGSNYYDASISTVPHNALVIVDMRVMDMKCTVRLPGEPQELVYVPTSLHYKKSNSSNGSLDGGIIALITISAVAVFGLLVCCMFRGSASRKALDVSVEKCVEMTNGDTHINTSTHDHDAAEEEKREEEEEGTHSFVIGDPPSPQQMDSPSSHVGSGELA